MAKLNVEVIFSTLPTPPKTNGQSYSKSLKNVLFHITDGSDKVEQK